MTGTIELNQADKLSSQPADDVLCIDAGELFAADRSRLAALVRTACLDTGFFYISLAAAQQKAVAAMLPQMRRFFALDDADARKVEVRQRDGVDGWVPRYTEPAYQPGTLANVEAFEFGRDALRPGAPCWPRLPGFRDDARACWNAFGRLGDAVFRVLALALGLDENFLASRCDSRAHGKLRLLYYAGDAGAADERSVGIAAHTDFECITLLYQTAPGLELRSADGEWLDTPAEQGRVIVLLDDMLERWTNGFLPATGHRVRRTAHERFSIVMFMAANNDIEIAPLPQFVSPDQPPAYAPVLQSRHIEEEIARASERTAANLTL